MFSICCLFQNGNHILHHTESRRSKYPGCQHDVIITFEAQIDDVISYIKLLRHKENVTNVKVINEDVAKIEGIFVDNLFTMKEHKMTVCM